MKGNLKNSFRLGDWQVYPLRNVLLGPGGEVHIEPKVMQVLVLLAENAGEVLEREQMLDTLWAGRAFSDEPLNRCIASLRRALRDSPKDPKYIQTIPKSGYRLVCPVEYFPLGDSVTGEPEEIPVAREKQEWIGRHPIAMTSLLIVTLATAMYVVYQHQSPEKADSPRLTVEGTTLSETPVYSIAVLPFVILSDDADARFFGDGVAEEILNRLGRIDALRVTARTSSFRFRGVDTDIYSIAEKLGVATILEGSIRKAGNRIRVTAQLINADDGYQIWSDSFNRDITDIFAVQDEIAVSIANALKIELLSDVAVRRRPTNNMEAYEHFLKARYLTQTLHEDSLNRAIEHFDAAIKLDDQFAEAWAGLAEASMLRYTAGWAYGDFTTDRSVERLQAESIVQPALIHALTLNPDLPDANTSLALYLWYFEEDVDQAIASLRKVVEANSNFAPALKYLGVMLLQAKHQPLAAVPILEQAQAINPLEINTNRWLTAAFLRAERIDDAIRVSRLIMDLDPDDSQVLIDMSGLLLDVGRVSDALELASKAVDHVPDNAQALTMLATAYMYLDEFETAKAVLTRLSSLHPDNFVTYYAWDNYYTLLDDVRNREMLAEQQLGKIELDAPLDLFQLAVLQRANNAFVQSGRLSDAERLADLALQGPFFDSFDELRVHLHLAYLYKKQGRMGDMATALAKARSLIPGWQRKTANDYKRLYVDAIIAILEDDEDRAVSYLNQINNEVPHLLYGILLAEPTFDELDDQPGFRALIDAKKAEFAR